MSKLIFVAPPLSCYPAVRNPFGANHAFSTSHLLFKFSEAGTTNGTQGYAFCLFTRRKCMGIRWCTLDSSEYSGRWLNFYFDSSVVNMFLPRFEIVVTHRLLCFLHITPRKLSNTEWGDVRIVRRFSDPTAALLELVYNAWNCCAKSMILLTETKTDFLFGELSGKHWFFIFLSLCQPATLSLYPRYSS